MKAIVLPSRRWNLLAVAAGVMLAVPCGWGADGVLKPMVASKFQVNLVVRHQAGNYKPMGGGGGLAAARPSSPADGGSEQQTLVIDVTNLTRETMENLKIRYSMFKVTTTYRSSTVNYGGRERVYERTATDSAPTIIKDGVESVTLRSGEKRTVTAIGKLAAPRDDQPNRIRDSRGYVIDNVPQPQEQFYGYVVEVVYNGEVIAEKLMPNSIREDIKQARRR